MAKPNFNYNSEDIPDAMEAEERKGLLNEDEERLEYSEGQTQDRSWSRKKIVVTATILIGLLCTGAFARILFLGSPIPRARSRVYFSGDEIRSNGTHDFRRTVLLVSIDGLRADYLDRGLTPHLLDISKQGLRAKSMKPIFPTQTFPNHWALMTGLHAESHGIVANNFWDPASSQEFHYNKIESCWISRWWLGEPMWETAEKAGLITANLMWPGPPKTSSGTSSTYFIPWKNHVPLEEKLVQILDWIDTPIEFRPQLILAYEPSLDQAGHATGPYSARVNQTLVNVDVFAKDLHTALKARNLTDIVDVVFVSDHGMTDTSHPEHIYMEDILGMDGLKDIEHEDGWPSMGLRFFERANATHHLETLLKASRENSDKFDVFTHDTMPERYHFSHNERIAPIYVVPKMGYILTTRAEGDVGMSKGNHGYDNDEVSMQAMFVAHGPFSFQIKTQHQERSALISRRPEKDGWHSTSDDTYIMKSFQNVEVYNLIMKLLGIEEWAAKTNGTEGFWDKFFENKP